MFLSTLLLTISGMPCYTTGNRILPINNDKIILWKQTTPNLFLARGHAIGVIGAIYPMKNGHNHFQLLLAGGGTIEVIYNTEFGALPPLNSGMNAEICGDYITSSQDTAEYPASPDGAILHWVHKSTKVHLSGYVIIDGKLFGQLN